MRVREKGNDPVLCAWYPGWPATWSQKVQEGGLFDLEERLFSLTHTTLSTLDSRSHIHPLSQLISLPTMKFAAASFIAFAVLAALAVADVATVKKDVAAIDSQAASLDSKLKTEDGE